MARVYAQIDVMTLTSHNEGTSVAIIESMATGLPFVALNIGGMPDLMVGSSQKLEGFDVFENGILVYPRDAVVIAGAVNMLGQSATVRQRMGRTGSEFAMERFSKERLVGDLENLYQKLAHPDLRRDPAVLYRPASRPQSNPTHHR